jgi:predicted ATP-grasp superfamily ATP-dependent carboligase
MRILVYEFATGGGLAGREVPESLAREGAAMLTAVLEDLSSLPGHSLVTTSEERFPRASPEGVEVVTQGGGPSELDRLLGGADAVWLIAPETGGCLESLARRVERFGKRLVGPGSGAIRRASDKVGLGRRLARHLVPSPPAILLDWGANFADAAKAASRLGYPCVVKPPRGAGSQGVSLARDESELPSMIEAARAADGRGSVLLQEFVAGVAASVSLIANRHQARVLALNAQSIGPAPRFAYLGGETPLEHPLAGRAAEVALGACRALPGLCGWIGVDLVLTDSEAVVIEVNPRLTTAYLGVRSAVDSNLAGLVLASEDGGLPPPVPLRRHVRFSAEGRIALAALPDQVGPNVPVLRR